MSSFNDVAVKKGDDLMKAAEKKLTGFSWFGLDGSKYETAADLYLQAGAQYKIATAWEKAANAYSEYAKLSINKTGSRSDGAQGLSEAGRALKNISDPRAISLLEQAATIMMEDNRFGPAAKLYMEMGEIGIELMDRTKAVECFLKASDCYKAANSKVTSESQRVRAADLMALDGKYTEAMQIYEEVINSQADNASASFGVSTHMFKALLCNMLIEAGSGKELIDSEARLERYRSIFPRFDGGKECRLIEQLLPTFITHDADAFTDAIVKYDNIYKLDQWYSELLWKLKKFVQGEGIKEVKEDEAYGDLL